MASPKLRLKLLIDKKENRVIFAEAEKDFVDFLFDLLCLPIAQVIKILKSSDTYGSLKSLYKSFEDLKDEYIQHGSIKTYLLNPCLRPLVKDIPKLLPQPTQMKLYRCSKCSDVFWDFFRNSCCYSSKFDEVSVPSDPPQGYVKGVFTYIVMDDLSVRPASMMAGITLVLTYKDINSLEERVVEFGTEEAKKLLKASMHSETVLTDIFLVKGGCVSDVPIKSGV